MAEPSSDPLAALTAMIAPDRTPPTEADLLAHLEQAWKVHKEALMQSPLGNVGGVPRPAGSWATPTVEAWRESNARLRGLYWKDEGGLPPTWYAVRGRLLLDPGGPDERLTAALAELQPPEPAGEWQRVRQLGELKTLAEVHHDARAAILPHPLAPLVRAWFEHPMPTPLGHAETRPDPIWAGPLTMAAPDNARTEALPPLGLLPDAGGESAGPAQLPMFGPDFDHYGGEFQASVLPVGMYQTRGKGAPLALRLLMRAVLDTPQNMRGGPVYTPRTPWRDVVAELLPGGYQSTRQWPGLQHGLKSLNADPRFLVPVEVPTPDGKTAYVGKRVVLATEQPLTGHRAEWLRFLVDLPAGAERGPIAHRAAWFLAAAHSTARFALATGLAVLWDRPGKTRVKPASAAPFVQSADFARYRVLSRRELASLTFPNGWPKRLRRKGSEDAAVEHLRALEKTGYCRIRRERGGWRTMPGPDWPGWTPAQRLKLLAE